MSWLSSAIRANVKNAYSCNSTPPYTFMTWSLETVTSLNFTLFLDNLTLSWPWRYKGVGGQYHAPAALHPGKTRYPLYRWLGGSQRRCGQVRKISPPPGFLFCTILLVSCTLLVWNCSGIRRKTERLRAVDFSIMKHPTASVGSEPAILGSRGQHANP
jgi:hypothetical protein